MNLSDILILAGLALLVVCAVQGAGKHFRGQGGCCGGDTPQEKRLKPSDRNRSHYPHHIRLEIAGIHCDGCRTRILNSFHSHSGYLAAAKGTTVDVYTKEETDEETLKFLVGNAGTYRIESVEYIR